MDLSIIILSYNTKDITGQCLLKLKSAVDSLQKKTGNNAEVIVLDNASSDGSVEMIKTNYPWVQLIESKENTGFSRGNNLAFKKTRYPNILFLNSDVYVGEDTLIKSLEYFKNHGCNVLGVRLVFENGKFQPSAGNLPTPINTIFWILGFGQLFNPFHPKSENFFSQEREVGWIMGAFFMIKRETFISAGGFDENIFMYMDEIDLCKRVSDLGFKICYAPVTEAVHLHRASSKDNPEKAFTLELKGMKVYLKKYHGSWYQVIKLFLILGLVLRVIAFSLFGRTARARAYIEGLKEV